MTVQPEKFERIPFEVEAVKVTEENMVEVAEWCGGEIRTVASGDKYIKVEVHNAMKPRQTKAFAGDRILKAETGFKVYTTHAFERTFRRVTNEAHVRNLKAIESIAKAPVFSGKKGFDVDESTNDG